MTSQTCCVPIRKMELLRGELRLLKAAIEQLHGRFELLLSEIADLQNEHAPSNEECDGRIDPNLPSHLRAAEMSRVLPYPEMPDAPPLVSATPVVDTSGSPIAPTIGEPSKPICVAPIDAIASTADASTPTHPDAVEDSGTASRSLNIAMAVAAITPHNLPDHRDEVAVLSPPSDQSCAIIVLDQHRKLTTERFSSSARAVSRWAAAAALIATILAVSVASTGFAYDFAELFSGR